MLSISAKEQFCALRDKVLLYLDYSQFTLICPICNQKGHEPKNCPVVHLMRAQVLSQNKQEFEMKRSVAISKHYGKIRKFRTLLKIPILSDESKFPSLQTRLGSVLQNYLIRKTKVEVKNDEDSNFSSSFHEENMSESDDLCMQSKENTLKKKLANCSAFTKNNIMPGYSQNSTPIKPNTSPKNSLIREELRLNSIKSPSKTLESKQIEVLENAEVSQQKKDNSLKKRRDSISSLYFDKVYISTHYFPHNNITEIIKTLPSPEQHFPIRRPFSFRRKKTTAKK